MDLIFTQMTVKEGIKHFVEVTIAEMIKYFKQLDKGAAPGKPVVIPTDPEPLTGYLKKVLDALNLMKVERDVRVKGISCTNGSKPKIYLKYVESISSPNISLVSIFATMVVGT